MAKKIALGKGIASLLQDTPNEILKNSLSKNIETEVKATNENVNDQSPFLIDIKEIKTNPNQPRKIFKDKELMELSDSIKENGVIQPLIVAKADKGYELIAGERRLRASKLAGLEKVPVVIKRGTDRDKMVMSIIENVQRSDLNCVEESLAYYTLIDQYNLTQEEVAKKLGKERSSVANYLRILKLPREVIELLNNEKLSFGHAKVLLGEKEREKQIRLAHEAVRENLTVRDLEKLIKKKAKSAPSASDQTNKYFNEKLDGLRKKLEEKTGYHFSIKGKNKGGGEVVIKYNNEAEFNDIYDYLLR